MKINNKQYIHLCSEYLILDKNYTLSNYAKIANNLYNAALYLKRQQFIKKNNLVNYNWLYKQFKRKAQYKENLIYYQMPYTQSTQQTLKEVDHVFYAYFRALKSYKANPNKFNGKPKMPHYLPKGQRHVFIITNQCAKIKNHYLIIQRLNIKLKLQENINKIQQVILKPVSKKYFKLIVIYKFNKQIKYKPDNKKYIGIDPGLDNVFTCVDSTMQHKPLLINGRVAKSINQYYNKRRAELSSLHAKYNQNCKIIYTKQGLKTIYQDSNAMQNLTLWRNTKLKQFAHKATKRIIDYALNCDANIIVIGHNKDLKRSSKLGKRTNQNFIGIPHNIMVQMLIYKANLQGITVIETNESYTSQTSFLDNEKPCKQNGNYVRKTKHLSPYNRRIKRGLFKSNTGILINADVNGAYQIIRKVFPKFIYDGIVDAVLHPVKWSPLI